MNNTIEVKVPDIGDFEQVEVIELLVVPGDKINIEDPLITVESDKASMEIPSSEAGIVQSVLVKIGDAVSEGSAIVVIVAEEKSVLQKAAHAEPQPEPAAITEIPTAAVFDGSTDIQTQVVVLGSGPGGYTAAFRAADLGKQVVLIEKDDYLGGVCLNVGCIPSKALLHVAEVLNEAREFSKLGVTYQEPEINTDKLREHKNKVVGRLTGGLKQLAKQRKIKIVTGYGKFTSANTIAVEAQGSTQSIAFEHCIIAAGSSVTKLPFIPWENERVWDSTDALELKNIPKRFLIIGGGIIGLEMATVYHALGSEVTVINRGPNLINGADRDLVKVLQRNIKKRYKNIFTNTNVTEFIPTDEGIICKFEGKNAPEQETFDNILVATGRTPNGKLIAAEKAGVFVNEQGFITVDSQQRTNIGHIFAIGDVVGQPMLAHKATHEAKIAAEVIDGQRRFFDARTIPSVAYTEPEVAWCGQTEEELKAAGIDYEKGIFPWAASGRALSVGADAGMTKVLYDKQTQQMLGTGIVGKNAGELIAEAALAVEMGAEMEDVALTIHPHPTLSETINFATEVAEGSCTDIYAPKRK
ncbi:MAG: dihydrolipoyl dehydrogenase [gamma proteobacterium symbiont of Taylorina sp.]|nr:dihydrolipoyl dehydrogenase [gamma proteobacterium symbiont of Taylorina sp.]